MKRLLAAAGVVLLLASCAPASDPAPVGDLADKVTTDGIYEHLNQLSDIANANGGSRSVGTPGYEATVDYLSDILEGSGFDVVTPEFEWLKMGDRGNPTLLVAGRRYRVEQASPLASTPQGGLSGLSLRPRKPSGCAAGDYGNVRGALAIVDDEDCSVVTKQNAAVANGAVGLLVVSAGGTEGLFEPGYYQKLTLPVAVIGSDVDAALRRTNAPVRLTLDGESSVAKSRNIIVQTKTGDTGNVVVAGAHLDSAVKSPGINDNGTGVAALLATASALGAEPNVSNAVRFTFWGSETLGAAGKYVTGLTDEQRDDIALYLNADMLGSQNAGFFTYDGDQSQVEADSIPEGSAGIERTLAGYLNLAGVRPADTPMGTTGDHIPFLRAGVPVGGVTTGSSQEKTAVQARIWGGRAGVPFDPNYRTPRDDIDNVDHRTLSIMGPAMAFAIGTYAQSIEGVNGVPSRDGRHR